MFQSGLLLGILTRFKALRNTVKCGEKVSLYRGKRGSRARVAGKGGWQAGGTVGGWQVGKREEEKDGKAGGGREFDLLQSPRNGSMRA